MEIFEQGVNLPEYARYAAESYVRRFENGENDLLDKIIELYTSLNDGENLKKYQIIAAQKGDRTLAAKWGKELFKTDKTAAYPLLCAADGERDPEIFFLRARILETGDGTATDLSAAKEYYRKAADAGYEPAARNLAGLLRKSTEKSELEQAFSMYRVWADNGDADAKFEVAEMLAQGIGTAPDAAGALVIWRELAETGYNAALLKISEACHTGSGCERDLARAIGFAEKAVAAKVKGAKKMLDELKAEKDAEIRAEKEAILNAAVAACENDATGEAELQVARLYETGKVAPKSPKKALEYYQKAAEKGNAEALFRLGKIAEDGNSALRLRPDIARALELYERAGKRGSGEAEKALENIQSKIADLEKKIRELSFSDQGALMKLLMHSTPAKYIEHEIQHSYYCGILYGGLGLNKSADLNKTLVANLSYAEKDWTTTDQKYWDSDDVKELTIGFMWANGNNDSEKCWHYAGKLISHGVYWPIFGFLAQCDTEDEDDLRRYLIILCAMKMHGCLEAAHIFEEIHDSKKDPKNWNTAFELAKKINVEWLEELSQAIDFPFISESDESKDTGKDAATSAEASGFPKFYSMNDLDEAAKSSNPEVKNWAENRMEILKNSFVAIKEDNINALDCWATLLENTLERKFSQEKYNPRISTPQMTEMGMTAGGDHLLYLYCNLVWRCHALGYARRFKEILNENNTTDMEYACEWIAAIKRHQIDAEWLAGVVGIMLIDDKILSDAFLNKIS